MCEISSLTQWAFSKFLEIVNSDFLENHVYEIPLES